MMPAEREVNARLEATIADTNVTLSVFVGQSRYGQPVAVALEPKASLVERAFMALPDGCEIWKGTVEEVLRSEGLL